jgi:hypothetical protein
MDLLSFFGWIARDTLRDTFASLGRCVIIGLMDRTGQDKMGSSGLAGIHEQGHWTVAIIS